MRTSGLPVFAVFVAILVFPFAARALITVGALDIPGQSESVVVVDGVAYVAVNGLGAGASGLRVIDVSDPTAPVEVGAVNTPGAASLVAVADGLAYVLHPAVFGGEPGGLRMIDVADPAAPVEVGAIEPLVTGTDFAVDGGFAYVLDFAKNEPGQLPISLIRVFDVSNPAAPVEFDPLGIPNPTAFTVVGGLAYVIEGIVGGEGGDLRIIDVSNPAAPVEVGAISGFGIDVAVVGRLAYVADFIAGLRVIDASDPTAPIEIGATGAGLGFGNYSPNLAVEDGNPYLAYRSTSYLRLIDVSNPAAPVGIGGSFAPTSGARDVAIVGGLAYVATDAGLAVVDLSNPAFPAVLGAIGTHTNSAQALTVAGGLAYVAAFDAGLRVIDVSNPMAPVEFGALDTPFEAADVAVAGVSAYVADRNPYRGFPVLSSLRVIDVSIPAAPVELGAIDTEGSANGVAVAGGLAYVASSVNVTRPNRRFGVLRVIDVSIPVTPARLGATSTPGGANGVAVADGLAYVADGNRGLLVIDVSNPAAPVALSAINTFGEANGVAVAGELAYVANDVAPNVGSLRLIDVSIPAALVELGAVSLFGRASNVAVAGALAYVATDAGLRLIDVSDPAAPVELGGVGGRYRDVAVVDGLAYVVIGGALRIIDFGPEYTGSIQIDVDIMPGGDPNSINPSLEGDLPVAILGSDSFDVADVDVTTLAFGPSGASFDHSHGPHSEDINGDGFTDLMAHFQVEETGIAFGDRMACISGETLDGARFSGCDDVRTVPDMDGDQLLDVEEATIGTHSLNPDTDGDGFDDGEEVLLMGTDPLDPLDPTPIPVPEPASWLMLVAGTAVLGLLYRRRR